MASTARIDELKKKFDENPRRYFAPLANEFRKSGEIEQAIMICEEFLPQQPGHMSGHIVYGQALYDAARFPEARTVFETALGLDPENLIALRHLGDIALQSGDKEAAHTWYSRVLDADPRNEEIQALLATVAPPPPAAPPAPMDEDIAVIEVGVPEPETVDVVAEVEFDEPAEAPAALHFDSSLPDTLPAGMPAIPAPAPQHVADDLLDAFTAHEFEKEVENPMGTPSGMAEGLVSTSFEAPSEDIQTLDLDASLGSGVPEFVPPPAHIATLEGLEGSGGLAHADLHAAAEPVARTADIDALDIDFGGTTPPAGDMFSPSAPTPVVAHPPIPEGSGHEGDLLDFDMPVADAALLPMEPLGVAEPEAVAAEPVSFEPPSALEMPMAFAVPVAIEATEEEFSIPEAPEVEAVGDERPSAEAEVHTDAEAENEESFEMPRELPPSVISAEAELTVEPPHEAAPFVTETMAELYLAQGLRDQARSVYEQLSAANPHDARLREKLASVAEQDAPADTGPKARDFFARIAGRRPGVRGAAQEPPAADDFAPASPAESHASAASQAEGEVTPQGAPAGSIDALFGGAAGAGREDSAAAALAQAFSGSSEEGPLLVGKPAHTASHELSLDSVFRDAPVRAPRTSQNFSFDQFFAGSAERASGATAQRSSSEFPSADTPPERGPDDIEQFNSWLQGLKPQ